MEVVLVIFWETTKAVATDNIEINIAILRTVDSRLATLEFL